LPELKHIVPKVRFNNQNSIINLKKVLKNTFHAEMFLILHGKQRETARMYKFFPTLAQIKAEIY